MRHRTINYRRLGVLVYLVFPLMAQAGNAESPNPRHSQGKEQTAAREITLPKDTAGLAQRLVELSRAKFDLQYKTFGVQEFLDMLDLAHRLRMAAARLEGDQEAQLAAAQGMHRQLEQISAVMEIRCRGTTTPIIDRELARYRVQEAAALVAKHADDRTAEIEHRRKAVVAAGELRRALTLAYETAVLRSTDMLRLSWYPCEARIALINLTIAETEEAKKARIVALERLLELADEAAKARRLVYESGLASGDELDLVLIEQCRIAARVAREQGDRDEELGAVRRIMDAHLRRLKRAYELSAKGVGTHSTREKMEMQSLDHQVQLIEVQRRHEAEEVGREAIRSLDILIAQQRFDMELLEKDHEQARDKFVVDRVKTGRRGSG